MQEIVQLLQLLGFVVNFEKSQLNPMHEASLDDEVVQRSEVRFTTGQ